MSDDQPKNDALRAFGQAVSDLRAARGMSVSELAAATETTSRRIERLEAGNDDPGYDLLLRLGEALDVRVSEIVIRSEELER